MYDAYEALPILEKLPLQIESIAAYGKLTRKWYQFSKMGLFLLPQKVRALT